ncbi:MAG: hypothetical protein FJ087_19240 [Deltaproteobacteria bacterium]|nr:hypothetical protein [Deltaproteobacteria bacterium]
MPLPKYLDDEEDDGSGWRYADVDLKPMMSIVCVLIPMLMFSFSFFEIKVQPVGAPKVGFMGGTAKGSGTATPEELKAPLNLTVIVNESGFRIKMTQEVVGPDSDQKIDKKTFSTADGEKVEDYDYPELYNRLVEIKKKFPEETSVNVGAETHITWEVVARTMDATRSLLRKEKYTSLDEYTNAFEQMDDQGKPKRLFPNVVFVVAE